MLQGCIALGPLGYEEFELFFKILPTSYTVSPEF